MTQLYPHHYVISLGERRWVGYTGDTGIMGATDFDERLCIVGGYPLWDSLCDIYEIFSSDDSLVYLPAYGHEHQLRFSTWGLAHYMGCIGSCTISGHHVILIHPVMEAPDGESH